MVLPLAQCGGLGTDLKKPNDSIRKHLLAYLLLPLCFLSLCTTLVAYSLASGFANAAYDRELLNSADSVAARLRSNGEKVWLDLPPAAIAVLRHNGREKLYYQVIKTDGTRIAGDTILEGPFPKLNSDQPLLRNDFLKNKEVRIARIMVDVRRYADGPVFVQVAETLEKRHFLTGQILLAIVVPQVLLILFGSIAVSLGVAKGLKPLRVLKDGLSVRSQFDLSPLSEDNEPAELQPLVRAVNDLLARLRIDLEFQQRFVANAAHQFRTPLAGLKTYIYAAKRLPSNEKMNTLLDQIESGTDRMSRLSNQLLALAKADPANKLSQHDNVDLNLIVSEVTAGFVERALDKEIELSFEGSDSPAIIRGNATSLIEMTTNIIENAILYTQIGGTIVVRLLYQNQEGHIALSVQDNGPGIPHAERERVFERFYRVLGTEAPGSGLGLAIVKEIASAHEAKVSIDALEQEIGTTIKVLFPSLNKSAS
jgi:two-component system, OmpR family, sensor histidine kinase TctE